MLSTTYLPTLLLSLLTLTPSPINADHLGSSRLSPSRRHHNLAISQRENTTPNTNLNLKKDYMHDSMKKRAIVRKSKKSNRNTNGKRASTAGTVCKIRGTNSTTTLLGSSQTSTSISIGSATGSVSGSASIATPLTAIITGTAGINATSIPTYNNTSVTASVTSVAGSSYETSIVSATTTTDHSSSASSSASSSSSASTSTLASSASSSDNIWSTISAEASSVTSIVSSILSSISSEIDSYTSSVEAVPTTTTSTSVSVTPTTSTTSSAAATSSSSSSSSALTPNGNKAGVAGGDSLPWIASKLGWWYDWSPVPSNDASGSAVGASMLWGDGNVDETDASRLAAFKDLSSSPTYIIAFEEPDCYGSGSAGFDYSTGVELWDSLIVPHGEKGSLLMSPSMCHQAAESGWLGPFKEGISREWDVTNIHINKNSMAGVKSDLDHYYNTYGKPIWVTEFACVDDSTGFIPCTDQSEINQFISDIVDLFESDGRVMAYAYSDGEGLGSVWPTVSNGALSDSGTAYLSALSKYH